MDKLISRALDAADKSADILKSPYLWGAVALCAATHLIRYFYRKWRVSKEEGTIKIPTTPSKNDGDCTSKALFLARESARQVALALEQRRNDPVGAYQNAVRANVLAQTAKDITTDVTKLSKSLGVDLYEYLAYTSSVLAELQTALS